jgi:hypothetical protein
LTYNKDRDECIFIADVGSRDKTIKSAVYFDDSENCLVFFHLNHYLTFLIVIPHYPPYVPCSIIEVSKREIAISFLLSFCFYHAYGFAMKAFSVQASVL